jgi:SPP1 family predicted phage head-tail adaptor
MSNTEIGELNKRIQIGKTKVTVTNGMSKKSFDTVNAIGTWSKVNGISNAEFYADNSTNSKVILNFTIRYRANVDDTMIISYNKKYYEINGIDDFMEQHIFLVIRAQEVKI